MKLFSVLLLTIFLQACATVGSADRPADYYQNNSSGAQTGLLSETSLNDNDARVQALLNYRVSLPKINRIAVLKLNTDHRWHYYSEDFTELTESISARLIDKLRSSERVYDASFLPAMLIPDSKSISVLRESAARFQADLLLGYRSLCNSYKKYNVLAADETKSYCSIEAVLLDVRSGIITKSVVSVENFAAIKSSDDKNFSETVKKAELEATANALGNVAEQVVKYLEEVPVL